ncbi:MAG: hypothetical protein AWU59_1963 [Methanolobus sp. T82-4]|nr:hypothetical protein [Methanolobus zinderi]KXS41711.1 MAG: hypothetical protein AWU59_1963 [Methanolobus sp. T82-4]
MKEKQKICECGNVARNVSETFGKKVYRCDLCYEKYLAVLGVKLR